MLPGDFPHSKHRYIILLITLFSLSAMNAIAQSDKPREIKSKNGMTYLAYASPYGNFNIRNSNNKLFKIDIHKNIDRSGYETSESTGYVTHTKESNIKFYALLNDAFKKEGRPLPSQNIMGRFYFDKYGHILEIDFIGIEIDNKLIDDINLIESTLIGNFSFTTVPEKLKDGEVYSLAYVIRLTGVK